jgi:hypothetical protein
LEDSKEIDLEINDEKYVHASPPDAEKTAL